MALLSVAATQVVQELARYDSIVDARSEDEFALDHLPGAVNWPTLDNEERHLIGTMYKERGGFEAKKHGAALAAHNIGRHITHAVLGLPRDWKPLLYCWRGGKRSGALALVLDQIGFRVSLIEGGYKAFRAAMLVNLDRLASQFDFRVVCGTTGSGKTRLLHALARRGAQVLDLEALASHRSSVLGALPGQAQPSQKGFDSLVWNALRQLDAARPVYVESESRKVGNVAIAPSLMEAIRAGACLQLVLEDPQRVELLLEEYPNFRDDPMAFCERLDVLTELRSKAVVDQWKRMVRGGAIESVVQDLLVTHYDPTYLQSMRRNFPGFANAMVLQAPDRSAKSMDQLAGTLLDRA